MFFVLSAYLLTELLLRERAQTGAVSWKNFVIRRTIRIWPLYYAALAIGFLITRLYPEFAAPPNSLAALSTFTVSWTSVVSRLGLVIGPLWSISVEEQFYLVWAPVVKFGGAALSLLASVMFAALSLSWLWIYSPRGWALWFATPVELLFFSVGVAICLALHGRPSLRVRPALRACPIAAGLLCLIFAAKFGGIGGEAIAGLSKTNLYLGYTAVAGGCAAIFIGILGIEHTSPVLIHLGKISYGLYLFHGWTLALAMSIARLFPISPRSATNMIVTDSIGFLLCLPLALFSYHYFERPLLKMKTRFEMIRSRPA